MVFGWETEGGTRQERISHAYAPLPVSYVLLTLYHHHQHGSPHHNSQEQDEGEGNEGPLPVIICFLDSLI